MSRTRVNFRFPESLVTRADVAAEVAHKTRTDVVIEALRQYLADTESDEQFREAVVDRFFADEIDFETLAAVVGRQDAEVARASKAAVDRGLELSDDVTEFSK